MTNQLASLEQRDYFYLDPFSSVNLGTYIIKAIIPCSTNNSNCMYHFLFLHEQNEVGKIYP